MCVWGGGGIKTMCSPGYIRTIGVCVGGGKRWGGGEVGGGRIKGALPY